MAERHVQSEVRAVLESLLKQVDRVLKPANREGRIEEQVAAVLSALVARVVRMVERDEKSSKSKKRKAEEERRKAEEAAAAEAAKAEAAEAAARSEKLLASLAKYLEHCGGSAEMITGWYTMTEFRKEGATAGTYDSYFFNAQVSGSARRSRANSPRAHSSAGLS
jgi:beta-glucosidase-like glycosyl hydrolase